MMIAQTESEEKLQQNGFYPTDAGVKAAEEGSIEMDISQRVSSLTELHLLFKRELANLRRNKIPLVVRFGITSFLNILFGLIFQGIGELYFFILCMIRQGYFLICFHKFR